MRNNPRFTNTVLTTSATRRLAGAVSLVTLLWLAVAWALSGTR